MEPYDDEKLLPPTYNIHYVDDVESEKITDVEVKIRRESENEKKRGSCFEKLRVIENKKVTAEGHFQVSCGSLRKTITSDIVGYISHIVGK